MNDYNDYVRLSGNLMTGLACSTQLHENIANGSASAIFVHMQPKDWKRNKNTGLLEPDYRWIDDAVMGRTVSGDSCMILDVQEIHNLVTNTGRVFLHTQGYATTGIGSNGLNYIALSNDATAPAASDTTLAAEIVANGLSRAQGTVTLPTGSGNQTTVAKTFTATGTQAAQKAALFTASSSGTMNHELLFTQRSLIAGDTLAVTFTITLG